MAKNRIETPGGSPTGAGDGERTDLVRLKGPREKRSNRIIITGLALLVSASLFIFFNPYLHPSKAGTVYAGEPRTNLAVRDLSACRADPDQGEARGSVTVANDSKVFSDDSQVVIFRAEGVVPLSNGTTTIPVGPVAPGESVEVSFGAPGIEAGETITGSVTVTEGPPDGVPGDDSRGALVKSLCGKPEPEKPRFTIYLPIVTNGVQRLDKP